ncbi:MAG: 4Fe-4S ferredoxin [Acidobacteria bacterium]|nr:MAG: 4Fe-4S ferredoxin [Acidobacteriota bacterium]
MLIDPNKCVACGNCVSVCPMGAIYIDPGINRATVNQDECVECYTCFRGMSTEHLNPTMVRAVRKIGSWLRWRFDPEPDVCPTAAITEQLLEWPRIVRRAFSDPIVPHESTGVHGRGTEEVKTNDVTHRVGPGEAGFTVEFGRPTIGVRFRQIQEMTHALAALGIEFEKRNPVTSLMSDLSTGDIREDILNEKILSAIVEFKTSLERVPEVLRTVKSVAGRLDTVVAVGASARCDEAGQNALEDVLRREEFAFVRGKTNLGLGRASAEALPAEAVVNL